VDQEKQNLRDTFTWSNMLTMEKHIYQKFNRVVVFTVIGIQIIFQEKGSIAKIEFKYLNIPCFLLLSFTDNDIHETLLSC
jgi:hypothetical protein